MICLAAQVIGPIDHAWRLKDIVPLFQGALDNFQLGQDPSRGKLCAFLAGVLICQGTDWIDRSI